MTTTIDQIQVIDADTHLVEPPDLWTSRLPERYGDLIPHVEWDDTAEEEAWFMGDQRLSSVSAPAQAGWPEYPPLHPPRWSDADPATWDPKLRLGKMDEYGIHTQVLYPNVAMFSSSAIQGADRSDLQLAFVQAYNDYQTEFCGVAPDRFLAMTTLPFWDLAETITEMQRCAEAGHKGVIFSQDPSAFGLPGLTDRHWDPLWASAQELGLPVNFHIASGDMSLQDGLNPENGDHANYASMGVSFFMGNARTIAQLICGGICHRFPNLDFVSVESGIGWLPFALDSLDWQWKNCGVVYEHPEYDLLPSEYFRRQIYGCFWFERETAMHALELLGDDNVLFETDFPHPTSMSPGPASGAIAPQDYIREALGGLSGSTLNKLLHDNAARIYHLD